MISSHLFLLFEFVLISESTDPLSILVSASKLCVLCEQKEKLRIRLCLAGKKSCHSWSKLTEIRFSFFDHHVPNLI